LKASAWAEYYKGVYGEVPSAGYPISPLDFWMLYDEVLIAAKVSQVPSSIGDCPKADPPLGQRYMVNNIYTQRLVSWIWHPYPYKAFASNAWVEVIHETDPFHDEMFGAWFQVAPGSGVYYNLGDTLAFAEHQDAYTHFGVHSGDYNEQLAKKASAQGYDSLQFYAHVDPVSYPCDTKHTGVGGLSYMGFEVLATKLVGSYACGAPNGAPASIKSGWLASKECKCDNNLQFLNCKQGVHSEALHLERAAFPDKLTANTSYVLV